MAAAQADDDAGTKQATKYYQQAAGAYAYLREYMAGVLNKVRNLMQFVKKILLRFD